MRVDEGDELAMKPLFRTTEDTVDILEVIIVLIIPNDVLLLLSFICQYAELRFR